MNDFEQRYTLLQLMDRQHDLLRFAWVLLDASGFQCTWHHLSGNSEPSSGPLLVYVI